MTPLKANEAIQMITRPVEGVIRFDYGVTNRIAELTSNHPYYLSLFNQVLFNRYAREGWVNLRHMDETLETVLRMELPAFDGVWDEATAIERAVLTAMASFKGVHGVFSQQDIMPLFLRRTREADEKVIITALESLSFRGVLVRMGALSYRFFVDLFRSWVQEYYDFETALAEVVWSNPARRSEQATVSRSEPTGESPSSQQGMRGQWPVWLIGLGGVTVLGIVILALILLLGDSPDDPATSQFVEGALAGEVVSFTTSTPGTPTVTLAPEPTTTATPTPPLVVSRLLPSIAYMARQTQQGDQEEALPWQIHVMNIDGSNATSVSDLVANDTTPVWSPDGSKLVFVSQRDGNRELYVMDVSGHNLLNLTNHPANDWTPTWSPDGTKIVFSSDRTRAWELYAIDADGNNLQQLTNDQAGNISPVWSPDGQYIAFSSKRDGNWEIYRMRIDGSDLRRLTNNDSNDLAPVWSYSGDLIAYETNVEGNVEIYVMTSAGGNPRNISRLPYANDHGPVWSPDDKRLVFYSNREGNWDLFSVELDGSDAVNLTNTPDIDEQTPAWRP
jgi:TolB protein